MSARYRVCSTSFRPRLARHSARGPPSRSMAAGQCRASQAVPMLVGCADARSAVPLASPVVGRGVALEDLVADDPLVAEGDQGTAVCLECRGPKAAKRSVSARGGPAGADVNLRRVT